MASSEPSWGKEADVDQLPLHLSIAFFGIQVVAWTGLCVYLYATRTKRANSHLAALISDSSSGTEGLAQA
jgi:hypothetical protein